MTKRVGVPEARQDKGYSLNAFTLAEVLITLGIIGVVAAMTIPTLISNTQGAQFKTAYKKALSTLNQAVLMNLAMDDTDLSSLVAEDEKGADADGSTDNTMSYILRNRLQSATNITDDYFADGSLSFKVYAKDVYCTSAGIADSTNTNCHNQTTSTTYTLNETIATDNNWLVFTFSDGTSFGYNGAASSCTSKNKDCIGFIDVNGTTNPNRFITCDGTTDGAVSDCTSINASLISDIYPVFFHGQTVEPASDATKAVLFGK